MKKLFTFFFLCFLGMSGGLSAQSLGITYVTPGPVNEDANTLAKAYSHIQNNGGKALSVVADRIVENTATGHSTYFCWGVDCYPPSTSTSPNPINLAVGQQDSSFLLYCVPNGNTGTSYVTMSFYDQTATTDSVQQTYVFTFTPVGVDQEVLDGNRAGLSAFYPNPANTQTRVVYTLGKGFHGKLHLYDLLGRDLRQYSLNQQSGHVDLELSNLKQGIYFATLVVDGKEMSTRKLIVSH